MKPLLLITLIFLCNVSRAQYDVISIKVKPKGQTKYKTVQCGLAGTASDEPELTNNPKKNRYDFPKQSDIDDVNITDLLNSKFEDFNEGVPVRLTGYVYDVKHGAPESCNCGAGTVADEDTHIEITPNAKDIAKKYRIIVEVSPRIRLIKKKQNKDFTTAGLKKQIKGKRVQVEGWLFYDVEHELESFAYDAKDKKGRKNWRSTCWEIHPITKITVL